MVLASHQCGPGSIPGPSATYELSLLLVLVPAPRVFLRVLRFSSLHKNQHSKFQLDPPINFDHHAMLKCALQVFSIYFYLFTKLIL